MNSPVSDILEQLVTFDKTIVKPVYIQVAQQVINAIQRGYLEKGSKLPGTRSLGELLNIHRNTAVAIYDEIRSYALDDNGDPVICPNCKAQRSEVYYARKGIFNKLFPFFEKKKYRCLQCNMITQP